MEGRRWRLDVLDELEPGAAQLHVGDEYLGRSRGSALARGRWGATRSFGRGSGAPDPGFAVTEQSLTQIGSDTMLPPY